MSGFGAYSNMHIVHINDAQNPSLFHLLCCRRCSGPIFLQQVDLLTAGLRRLIAIKRAIGRLLLVIQLLLRAGGELHGEASTLITSEPFKPNIPCLSLRLLLQRRIHWFRHATSTSLITRLISLSALRARLVTWHMGPHPIAGFQTEEYTEHCNKAHKIRVH